MTFFQKYTGANPLIALTTNYHWPEMHDEEYLIIFITPAHSGWFYAARYNNALI